MVVSSHGRFDQPTSSGFADVAIACRHDARALPTAVGFAACGRIYLILTRRFRFMTFHAAAWFAPLAD